jgi:hypothetical protein
MTFRSYADTLRKLQNIYTHGVNRKSTNGCVIAFKRDLMHLLDKDAFNRTKKDGSHDSIRLAQEEAFWNSVEQTTINNISLT